MNITIPVTKKHCEQGVRRSPSLCPIALAVREASGLSVSVTASGVSIDGLKALLPEAASKAMIAYDAGKGMQPMKLVLELRRA